MKAVKNTVQDVLAALRGRSAPSEKKPVEKRWSGTVMDSPRWLILTFWDVKGYAVPKHSTARVADIQSAVDFIHYSEAMYVIEMAFSCGGRATLMCSKQRLEEMETELQILERRGDAPRGFASAVSWMVANLEPQPPTWNYGMSMDDFARIANGLPVLSVKDAVNQKESCVNLSGPNINRRVESELLLSGAFTIGLDPFKQGLVHLTPLGEKMLKDLRAFEERGAVASRERAELARLKAKYESKEEIHL